MTEADAYRVLEEAFSDLRAGHKTQSERISELLRFNNEFEERARVAERKIERAAQIAEAHGKPCIAMAIRGLK